MHHFGQISEKFVKLSPAFAFRIIDIWF